MQVINESIYDHPKYYDLVFGADCAAELRFICDVNQQFMNGKATRLFEPACGTGRLLHGLAKRGFEVGGIDLNSKAIEFCNQRFERNAIATRADVADMSDFKPKKKWDLAFNTINSFRHLTSEQEAFDHMRCMANGTRKDGIYLVGIHLTPTAAPPSEEESWSARRGHLSIVTHMWTIERAPKKRLERFGIRFDIYTPKAQMRIVDELKLRSYTPKQFQALIDAEGSWNIEATFDFGYDIREPITVDATCEDVIYVLRKQGK
ncbi:MAG: class I SAM-dependent methyltransferase [Pirellulaceae bacterium]